MADNFAIYVPFQELPAVELIASIAPGAQVTGTETSAEIVWPDVTVSLALMPMAEVPEHLNGMVGWARKNGGSDAIVARIFHTLGVAGCSVTPAFDDEGKAVQFCFDMTAASSGYCFANNTIYDGDQRDLLADGMPRPSALDVRYRAEIILTSAARALLEQNAGTEDEQRANAIRKGLREWLAKDPARLERCGEDELAFLDTPIGEADPQEALDRTWASEAACVMLWALSAHDLASFETTDHPFEVGKAAGVNGDTPAALATPKLRDDAALGAMFATLAGIHWRLRDHRVRPDNRVDFAAYAKKNFFAPFAIDGLPIVNGDLSLDGKPLSQLSAEEVGSVGSIALERHRGINWVMGVHDWWHVEAPT